MTKPLNEEAVGPSTPSEVRLHFLLACDHFSVLSSTLTMVYALKDSIWSVVVGYWNLKTQISLVSKGVIVLSYHSTEEHRWWYCCSSSRPRIQLNVTEVVFGFFPLLTFTAYQRTRTKQLLRYGWYYHLRTIIMKIKVDQWGDLKDTPPSAMISF